MTRAQQSVCFFALMVMALSLGPSFAHVLEAPPRLTVWSPELWREATVFNGQFRFFAIVGAPLDLGAIALGVLLSWFLRHRRPAVWFAMTAAALYALSLATWFTVVAPANAELAQWVPGPIPDNFEAIRNRWETGHMIVASVKVVGLAMAILAVLAAGRAEPARTR